MLMLKELPKYECLLEKAQRYPDLDPSACEAFLHLMRGSGDLDEAFGDYFDAHGISQGRFIVLMLLNRRPEHPANPADIAARSGVTRATMTGLIDVLERDGLVKREPSAEDRRMMMVRLTENGIKFLDAVLPEHYRLISAVMHGLTPVERRTLVSLVDKIQQTLPAARVTAQTKPAASA